MPPRRIGRALDCALDVTSNSKHKPQTVSTSVQDARRCGVAPVRLAEAPEARGRWHGSQGVHACLWCMMQCAGQPGAHPRARSCKMRARWCKMQGALARAGGAL